MNRTPRCGRRERFVDGQCVSDNGSNSDTLLPTIKRKTTFTPTCADGKILRYGQCVPSGGSGESGGLGCSRQVYDRLGHCPTRDDNKGYDGIHRRPRSLFNPGNNRNDGG